MSDNRVADTRFIPPGENLDEVGSDLRSFFVSLEKSALDERWRTPQGRKILETWVESGFDRECLDQLVGRYDGHTDLRGAVLSGRDLSKADLSCIDFFSADSLGR